MKIIKLTKGKSAICDDEDYVYLSQFKWSVDGRGYPQRHRTMSEHPRRHPLTMGRDLLKPSSSNEIVDHRNGNPLDNRRSNLRVCTKHQNQMNQKRRSDNTTGFKGVSVDKRTGRFVAYIWCGRRKKHIGIFDTASAAAAAYNAHAVSNYGEFARTNYLSGDCDGQ